MNTKYKSLEEKIFILNPDEKFYKNYYRADRSLQGLKTFLFGIDKDDAIRRHLVIPDLLPEIISYEMNDEEYFKEGDVIFIAPGIYHTMEVFQDDSIVFNILIQQKTFHQMFLPLSRGNNLQSQFFKEGLYNPHRLEYLVYHTKTSWTYLSGIILIY